MPFHNCQKKNSEKGLIINHLLNILRRSSTEDQHQKHGLNQHLRKFVWSTICILKIAQNFKRQILLLKQTIWRKNLRIKHVENVYKYEAPAVNDQHSLHMYDDIFRKYINEEGA